MFRNPRRLSAVLAVLLVPGGALTAEPVTRTAPLESVPRTAEERARIAAVTAATTDFSAPERFEAMQGGAATSKATANRDAFSHGSANMDFARGLDFKVGNGLFRKLWVSAPSSTRASDGLGPLFNARSCQRCHLKDGRGHPPENAQDTNVSMVLRVSVPGQPGGLMAEIADYVATVPEPTYGHQIQDRAVAGLAPEARLAIRYEEFDVALSAGETATLRRPIHALADPGYGELSPEAMVSARVAPQMIGLGLLEAIPVEDILARADAEDADGDGISGRANIVWSDEFGQPMLGRFGHKAGTATIREQAADAFATDMGISSPLRPEGWGDCTARETACRAAPDGASPANEDLEIDSMGLDLVTFYARNLAVPIRRNVGDPDVLRGKAVFHEVGCTACHTPKFVTDRLVDQPEQSFQLIWPHSDLLVHDMGEGLADHRPEARATGTEWRTAPLWGLGLTETVSGHSYLLHDGRARSILEAILWHGGEAEAVRQRVIDMPKADRDALITFLESL